MKFLDLIKYLCSRSSFIPTESNNIQRPKIIRKVHSVGSIDMPDIYYRKQALFILLIDSSVENVMFNTVKATNLRQEKILEKVHPPPKI